MKSSKNFWLKIATLCPFMIIFIGSLVWLYFEHPQSSLLNTTLMYFTVASVVAVVFSWLIKINSHPFIDNLIKVLLVSSGFIMIGYNYGLKDFDKENPYTLDSWNNILMFLVAASFTYAFIIYLRAYEQKVEKITELEKEKIIPMKEFLNKAKEKNANVLAVAGNLNALVL